MWNKALGEALIFSRYFGHSPYRIGKRWEHVRVVPGRSETLSKDGERMSRDFHPPTYNSTSIKSILSRVRNRDGLCQYIPHIEYLVGSNQNAFGGGEGAGGGLDISDKTQWILQSNHPVRFIVEREVQHMGEECLKLKYLDWVVLFGRSLISPTLKSVLDAQPEDHKIFEEKLGSIATAADCGMFSSDVHQTVVNIAVNNVRSAARLAELHLGNKYAVLVGDYFAIKAIYFAEKVKSSPVFLDIVRGVEDFSYSSFVSKLLDWEVGYPILPHEKASFQDWTAYAIKASGYFTGGLNAAWTFNEVQSRRLLGGIVERAGIPGTDGHFEEGSRGNETLERFVNCLALTLKATGDLQYFCGEESNRAHDGVGFNRIGLSPFLFISLPAILYQRSHPGAFRDFRNLHYELDLDRVLQMQQEIAQSEAINETKKLIREFSSAALEAYTKVGVEPFYSQVVQDLLKFSSDVPQC